MTVHHRSGVRTAAATLMAGAVLAVAATGAASVVGADPAEAAGAAKLSAQRTAVVAKIRSKMDATRGAGYALINVARQVDEVHYGAGWARLEPEVRQQLAVVAGKQQEMLKRAKATTSAAVLRDLSANADNSPAVVNVVAETAALSRIGSWDSGWVEHERRTATTEESMRDRAAHLGVPDADTNTVVSVYTDAADDVSDRYRAINLQLAREAGTLVELPLMSTSSTQKLEGAAHAGVVWGSEVGVAEIRMQRTEAQVWTDLVSRRR